MSEHVKVHNGALVPVLLLMLASIVGPSLLFAAAAWESRQQIVDETEQSVRKTVATLREHAVKVLEEQTLVLEQIDRRIRGMSWDEIERSEALHRDLAEINDRFDQIGAIWLVDPEGRTRASSRIFPMPPSRADDREYFQAQRERDVGVFIGAPIVGKLLEHPQFPISKRRAAPDGRFNGVIMLSTYPAYFTDFYAITAEGEDAAVGLFRTDGEILARYPSIDLPQRLPASSPLMMAVQNADSGLYRARSIIDGTTRIAGFSRVKGFPVVVFFGVGTDAVFARWHLTLLTYSLFIVPVALALFSISWLALKRTRQEQATFVKVAEAQAEAERANRAKSDFLASMSHEIRTPLNAVLGFAQLLQHTAAGSLSPRQLEYIGYIVRGGTQLLNIVRDVLDLAKIESGQMRVSIEMVDVADLLGELTEATNRLAQEKGLGFSLEPVDRRHATIQADRARLLQVLMNFVSNAVKYNRPGGSVHVSAGPAPGSEGWLRITVADTGRGIPVERQREVFQPFNRLGAEHGPIEGTGIGLSICHRIVELMGGRIGFWSEPDEGSRFWVEVLEGKPGEQPSAPSATKPLASAGEHPVRTVLYIEDNPASLTLMSRVVGELPNARILTASNGEIGVELALAHRPDVIIVDIHLPDIDGFDILRRLKAAPETAAIPVLALSADAMPREVMRGQAAGFRRYMTKPFKVADMIAAIEEACRPSNQPPATDERNEPPRS